jgi:hypothetical protein
VWRVYGGDDFQVLSIDLDFAEIRLETALEWKELYGITCPILFDPDCVVFGRFGMQTIPLNIIVDREHRLTYAISAFDLGEIIDIIDSLGVEHTGEFPTAVFPSAALSNYPNPFNPSTNISFVVEQSGPVELTVFDILGRAVADLVKANYTAGSYSLQWEAISDAGTALPSGSYWVRFETQSRSAMHRIVLIR